VSTTRQQQVEGLRGALDTFTSALYRREPARDVTSLEEAVRHVSSVAKDIASERSWLNTLWRR
jgi:hypothetical protein